MLTNERLKEITEEYTHAIYPEEVGQMARELLAIREAGDEEVRHAWENAVQDEIDECVRELGRHEQLDKLRDFATDARQQLREARAEIERLQMAIGCATTIKGDMVMRADDPLGMMQEICSYVATITRERDEARKEVERLTDNLKVSRLFVDGVSKHLECGATLENSGNWSSYCETVANNYMLRMTEACKLRDSLAAELAALKSAPGMEGVVGLLKHILSCIITVKQENTPEWMEYIAEEVNRINEAIGDPDRVVVNCCDIVIVRGKSEIVEGK